MAVIEGLKCIECGAESSADPFRYVCPTCSGNCEVVYPAARLDRADFSRGRGQARYLALLPLASADSLPPIPVGGTPLHRRDDLAAELGLGALFFKDDGRLPSASFKDRASAVVLGRAKEIGATEVCCASTGNAAAAFACLGASAGIYPNIFVPKSAPRGKIAQLVTFGARIFLVDGNYDAACDLSLAATERFGWYNRNTGFNPYTREGKKTVSFELLEDHAWTVPDVVIVSVGDGNIISGVHKGFREARDYGLVDRVPRIIAAQSELSAAVSTAVWGDGKIRPVSATTIADSISVDLPRDGSAAVRAVRETGGAAVTVSDEAILAAQRWLARRTGIFAEPAAACSAAVLLKAAAEGLIGEKDSVTVIITGNGLKDVEAVTRRLPDLPLVAPEIGALEAVIARRA
jgi:threonine synthase